jgi:hypothetical protein
VLTLLELRAVRFFFLGAGVDIGFAVDWICFLSHLVFCSASCASSELPKVKSTPESPSLLWISSLHSFLFRCDADILVPMRCGCGAVVLVSMWSGCSCFDSMRLFLFRFSAVVLVSIQCDYSCFDAVRLLLWSMMMFFALGGLLNQAGVQKHYEACNSLLMLVRATLLRYSLNYYACRWMFPRPVK